MSIAGLQAESLKNEAVLFYFKDLAPGHPAYAAFQMLGLRGLFPEWEARPDERATAGEIQRWCAMAGIELPKEQDQTRGTFAAALWADLSNGQNA